MNHSLSRLGLIITYRCNATCRHCFFESDQGRKEVLDMDLARNAINEAAELGASWVSFTGGEPFLELSLLESLIRYAKERGMKVEVVTNGHWGKAVETIRVTLESLIEHGLDVLNLSIDDFHQEQIPLDYVKNVYNAAVILGLNIVIMTTVKKESKITSNTIPSLLGDEKIQVLGHPLIRDPNALLIETPITPVGRAKNIREIEESLFTQVNCPIILKDIGIDPSGAVFPCCGPLASKLSLGRLKDSSLSELIEEAYENPVLSSIREGVSIYGAYTSKCHACVSLFE